MLCKLYRRPKSDDKVHFQSPDDAVTFDGFENPMSKDPSSEWTLHSNCMITFVL